jgi:hypothetical protein
MLRTTGAVREIASETSAQRFGGDFQAKIQEEFGQMTNVLIIEDQPNALSNLSFWVTSFPRRRESSVAIWIPACAGMTMNPDFMTVNPDFKSVSPNFGL